VKAPTLAALTIVCGLGTAPLTAAQTAPAPGGHAGHGALPEPQAVEAVSAAPRRPADLPPITDADRAAAFPALDGDHAVHDDMFQTLVLVDQLEWSHGDGVHGLGWNAKGWVGGDRHRFWFRTEGDGEAGEIDAGEAHALYGRPIARWWDVVAGVRQEVRPGPARTWAAIGLQGLAPYWFEVEATAYVGAGGRTELRFETEYELLITQRLVLQPRLELNLAGKDDPERGVGAGLSTFDPGLRLRYEIRREFAPYLGVTWPRKVGRTADLAAADGARTAGTRFVAGLRFWF
jgi:copper resistance protein B